MPVGLAPPCPSAFYYESRCGVAPHIRRRRKERAATAQAPAIACAGRPGPQTVDLACKLQRAPPATVGLPSSTGCFVWAPPAVRNRALARTPARRRRHRAIRYDARGCSQPRQARGDPLHPARPGTPYTCASRQNAPVRVPAARGPGPTEGSKQKAPGVCCCACPFCGRGKPRTCLVPSLICNLRVALLSAAPGAGREPSVIKTAPVARLARPMLARAGAGRSRKAKAADQGHGGTLPCWGRAVQAPPMAALQAGSSNGGNLRGCLGRGACQRRANGATLAPLRRRRARPFHAAAPPPPPPPPSLSRTRNGAESFLSFTVRTTAEPTPSPPSSAAIGRARLGRVSSSITPRM
jgi:hypothetical protein